MINIERLSAVTLNLQGTTPIGHTFVPRCVGLAVLFGLALYRRSLTTWVFVAMLIGAEVGYDAPAIGIDLGLLSIIFLRLIKTVIAPLIFSTLVVGIAGHADLKALGRLGAKAFLYFELVTSLALFVGLASIHLSHAGVGVRLAASSAEQLPLVKPDISDTLLHIFPENIAKSVAEGNILQVVVFSTIFALALVLVADHKRRIIVSFCESLAATMFEFTNIIMYMAPVAVGAAVAYTIGSTGLGVFASLFKLVLTLYASLLIFLLLVLLPIALLVGVPLRRFVKAIAEPVSIAFATSSSEAALPSAMEAMEAIGVPRHIVAFVIPAGYSFNLDGSTLYLSVALIFVTQVAAVHFSFGHELLLMMTLMLASKGTAGVSRGSLVVLLATVSSLGLPTGPVFLLLGIDQVLDMARTSVNVIGNCLAAVVVAIWEGALNPAEGHTRST
jgi:proton glutamate symport protein